MIRWRRNRNGHYSGGGYSGAGFWAQFDAYQAKHDRYRPWRLIRPFGGGIMTFRTLRDAKEQAEAMMRQWGVNWYGRRQPLKLSATVIEEVANA